MERAEFPAVLPAWRRRITQERIDAYAAVSGANDPLHVEPAVARASRFGGTIAQGLLVFAWMSELFMHGLPDPRRWVDGGRLEVAFRAPARPGDRLTVCGVRVGWSEREGAPCAEYEVWCENDAGVRVVTGRALVPADSGAR